MSNGQIEIELSVLYYRLCYAVTCGLILFLDWIEWDWEQYYKVSPFQPICIVKLLMRFTKYYVLSSSERAFLALYLEGCP